VEITHIPTERIVPYEHNPRKNDAAIAKVAASIKEFGFRQPIVVDEQMTIIAGHTRLLAALQLGHKSVPVHIAVGLTDAQVKAYRLADNRTHEDSEWINELLSVELRALKERGFDMKSTGFESAELEELLISEGVIGLTDEDAEAEKLHVPTSRLGDSWILGSHKLLCGDALKTDCYDTLLANEKVDMVFTDPPYNLNYSGSLLDKRLAKIRGVSRHKILNDNLNDDFYEFLQTLSTHLVSRCKGAIYICMAGSELDTLHRAFRTAGGYRSTFIIWAKNRASFGFSDYQRQYEPILYGWPNGQKHFWCGARNQTDLWPFKRSSSSTLHPTMKPVELIAKAIENSSKKDNIVLDSFAGSGSTVIACEKTSRKCRAMELDPKYCDVIVRRWQDFTGKEATLADTGATFAQTEKARTDIIQ
jgi:DNA modification methylase